MCGICGIYHLPGQSAGPVNQGLLARISATMVHRGPDGDGFWFGAEQRLGFGHRRLSIIDVSVAANQPMSDLSGRFTVVFNGEIYNHAEIKAELQAIGHTRWQTDHSDTETLLMAWLEWGEQALHKFRGMFAFALWDAQELVLWLVRDRIGIKPLYWTVHNGTLSFASEIKALLQDRSLPRNMNEEALFHYLSFLTAPAPHTLFEGIQKLPAGYLLKVSAHGDIHESCWWDVWDHVQPEPSRSEGEWAELVLQELEIAVRYRQVSDVPVGVFLSGGIDSSTNAALFSRNAAGPVKTFTIGYQGNYDSYTNETDFARLMAETIGADHHELLLTQDDLIDFLPQMVWLQDEPIADPVCVPVYYVSKLARDNGVIVCQVGEGADELFCGYPAWGNAVRLARLNRLPVPRAFKQLGCRLAELTGKTRNNKYAYLRRAVEGLPIFWSGAEGFYDHEKPGILHPRLRDRFAGRSSWEALEPHWQRFQANAWEKSDLHWMTYTDLKLRLPELLLMRVDKMSMGVSLEGRVPFLDHKLVELVLSIPEKIKYPNYDLKHLLKKAVTGVIPDTLIRRKKQGFGVPVHEWCLDRLGAHMRSELRSFCAQTEILAWPGVEKLFERQDGGRLWYLYNLALWWKGFS